jgi:RimJ/RimL family protein N-acetyltransferase
VSVAIRRARPEDVDYVLSLVTHPEVAPYLAAVRPSDRATVAALVARSDADPDAFGLFVIEVDDTRAGTVEFERVNARSRIAALGGLAVDPTFRGRRVGDAAARQLIGHLLGDLGFHRLQMEVYGFNERAQAHAERVGFTREGVRRNAYWRNEEWVDGVLYGVVAEDLGDM